MKEKNRNDLITIRVKKEHKEKIKEAAEKENVSMSNFVLNAALKRAANHDC